MSRGTKQLIVGLMCLALMVGAYFFGRSLMEKRLSEAFLRQYPGVENPQRVQKLMRETTPKIAATPSRSCSLSPPAWLQGTWSGGGVTLVIGAADIHEASDGKSWTGTCRASDVFFAEGRKESDFYSFDVRRTDPRDGSKRVQMWAFSARDNAILVTHSFSYASGKDPNHYLMHRQ